MCELVSTCFYAQSRALPPASHCAAPSPKSMTSENLELNLKTCPTKATPFLSNHLELRNLISILRVAGDMERQPLVQ